MENKKIIFELHGKECYTKISLNDFIKEYKKESESISSFNLIPFIIISLLSIITFIYLTPYFERNNYFENRIFKAIIEFISIVIFLFQIVTTFYLFKPLLSKLILPLIFNTILSVFTFFEISIYLVLLFIFALMEKLDK
jgi:hypothetical protein